MSTEQLQAALDMAAKHGSVSAAARHLNMSRETLQSRVNKARSVGLTAYLDAPTVEELPPSDLSFEERLATMKARNALRITHARAQAWQTVNIPVTGPYGLCFFGDPHLDDPYCDLRLVEKHATICRDTPGMFGVNGGDSINNWVGFLQKLYADQSATAEEGWELVEWFMHGLGVRWALWLLGNHDVWNTGKRVFDRLNATKILMRDWDAKIRLVSPDGECRLWARHDFKGSSIYNELHGLKRAAMFSGDADIYAAFHRHTWGTAQGETGDGKRFCLIRAKGYKEVDDYAIKGGFPEQLGGQSVVSVIQPRRGMSPIIHAFEDVETGADFLTFLRSKER
jgi:hypothetical protein